MDSYYKLWSAHNKVVAEKFLKTSNKKEVEEEIQERIEKKKREMNDKLKENDEFNKFR